MEKKTKSMDLNRETAMRLWIKFFGKETKVKDFAGREIAKDAYNDRNSTFGWNVDHILPQSKGGKTADYNLICCHIKTNDEKANKFPCFTANSKKYEIVKVENHYEIQTVDLIKKPKNEESTDKVNFFDSASGIKYFKKLKGTQNKPRWVGSVLIRLQNVSNTAVIDFIEKFFDEENISYVMFESYRNSETRITATNNNMSTKDEVSSLLDNCILLNTYIIDYFVPMKYVSEYDISYQINRFKDKQDMYLNAQLIDFNNISPQLGNGLFINELVYINSEAEKRKPNLKFDVNTYQQYNYTYTQLSKNLTKEVNRK